MDFRKYRFKIFICVLILIVIVYLGDLALGRAVEKINKEAVLSNMTFNNLIVQGYEAPNIVNGTNIDNNYAIFEEVQKEGLVWIGEDKLNNSEYLGLNAPCVVENTTYYDSYSFKFNSPCIIKKSGDFVQLITLKADGDIDSINRNAHKVIKNNILYYQSGNSIYTYNLESNEKKEIISDASLTMESVEQFDVNDNGDVLYTTETEKIKYKKIISSSGDEINLNMYSPLVFYSNDEIICASENRVYIYNINTKEQKNITKLKKTEFGTDISISQFTLTPDKKQALVHLVETDGKVDYYFYRILDIESGKSYLLNRGEYFSYPTWVDDNMVK